MSSSEKCAVCGKRGKRPCPATGGVICPACCGTHRGSKLNCPSGCSFYPLGVAGRELWEQLDESWIRKTDRRLFERLGNSKVSQLMERFTPRLSGSVREKMAMAYFPTLYYGLLVERNDQGKTVADEWEAEGWAGLNNDDKLAMVCRRKSFATVFEVQRCHDAHSVECLDLLEANANPFILHDDGLARTAPRFTKLLGWITPFDGYSRLSAAGYEIPELIWPAWREVMQKRLLEAQKTRPSSEMKQLLAEELGQASDLVTMLLQESRRRMLEGMDLHDCTATYALAGSWEEAKALLESKPEFKARNAQPPEAGESTAISAYEWVWTGESKDAQQLLPLPPSTRDEKAPEAVLARLELHLDRLILRSTSKAKYSFARQMLDKHLGSLARFESESIIDYAQRIAERDRVWPEGTRGRQQEHRASQPEPISPEANRQRIWEEHRTRYQTMLDAPVELLGGLTPRAAALDATIRPKLIEWLKSHLNHLDTFNRRKGLDLNLDWVLDELRIPELK